MEKIKNTKRINTKKNFINTTSIKRETTNKNKILEKAKKSIEKRKKIIHYNHNSLILNAFDKTKLMTKQNSNNFTISYHSDIKNNIKKIIYSNSCKKREKFQLKNNKTNNIFNKTINIKNKSPDSSNKYKKILTSMKTLQKNHFHSLLYKPNPTSNNIFSKFNKENYFIKVRRTFFRNQKTINNDTIINRSVELRNKIKKFKLKENSKVNLIKNKRYSNNTKTINNFNINDKDIQFIDENKSTMEICQTFSNKENMKTNENFKTIDVNIKDNKKDNKLKINTNYEKDIIKEISAQRKCDLKNTNKEKYFIRKMTKNKETNTNQKLKYLIREFCINNSKIYNNNIKNINEIKIHKSKNQYNECEVKEKEKPFNKDNNGKLIKNNNEIFETISDIKVKSYNEYEQEKKINENNQTENSNQINNNININININYNNINVNNPYINSKNDDFIEDRDEYNNYLKETFSKDRFSFKPVNNEIESNYDYYNDNNNMGEKLNKNDFITKNNNNIKNDKFLKKANTKKKVKNQIKKKGINKTVGWKKSKKNK